jgi:hypothetical protein
MDQESASAITLLWRALVQCIKLVGLAWIAMWMIWALVAVFIAATIVVTMPAAVILRGWKWWTTKVK